MMSSIFQSLAVFCFIVVAVDVATSDDPTKISNDTQLLPDAYYKESLSNNITLGNNTNLVEDIQKMSQMLNTLLGISIETRNDIQALNTTSKQNKKSLVQLTRNIQALNSKSKQNKKSLVQLTRKIQALNKTSNQNKESLVQLKTNTKLNHLTHKHEISALEGKVKIVQDRIIPLVGSCPPDEVETDVYWHHLAKTTWHFLKGKCYKLFNHRFYTRSEAIAKCSSVGGHLVEIHDRETNDFVLNKLGGPSFANFAWIGLKTVVPVAAAGQPGKAHLVWESSSKPLLATDYSNWSYGYETPTKELNAMLTWGAQFTHKNKGWALALFKEVNVICQIRAIFV